MASRADTRWFKVLDASGRALVYVYARETRAEADMAKVPTIDEPCARNGVDVLTMCLLAYWLAGLAGDSSLTDCFNWRPRADSNR